MAGSRSDKGLSFIRNEGMQWLDVINMQLRGIHGFKSNDKNHPSGVSDSVGKHALVAQMGQVVDNQT